MVSCLLQLTPCHLLFMHSQAAQEFIFISTSDYCGSYTYSKVQVSPATTQLLGKCQKQVNKAYFCSADTHLWLSIKIHSK